MRSDVRRNSLGRDSQRGCALRRARFLTVTLTVWLASAAEAQLEWGADFPGFGFQGVCQHCATVLTPPVTDNNWLSQCRVFVDNPKPECAALAMANPPLTVFTNWIGNALPDELTDVAILAFSGPTTLRPQPTVFGVLSGAVTVRTVRSEARLELLTENSSLFITSTQESSRISRVMIEGGRIESNSELFLGEPGGVIPPNVLENGSLTEGSGNDTRVVNEAALIITGDPPDPLAKTGLFVRRFENRGDVSQLGPFSTNADTEIRNTPGATWRVSGPLSDFGGSSNPFVVEDGASFHKQGDVELQMAMPLENRDGGIVEIQEGSLILACAGFETPCPSRHDGGRIRLGAGAGVVLDGGQEIAPGFNIPGASLEWTRGEIEGIEGSGDGEILVSEGATMTIRGPVAKRLVDSDIRVQGELLQSSGDLILVGNASGDIIIDATGVYDLNVGDVLAPATPDAPGTVTVIGRLRKSEATSGEATGDSEIAVTVFLVGASEVIVDDGKLTLTGGAQSVVAATPRIRIGSDGEINLAGQMFTLNSGGEVGLDGGTLDLAGGTFLNNGDVGIDGGTLDLAGGIFDNRGTSFLRSGSVIGMNGEVENSGDALPGGDGGTFRFPIAARYSQTAQGALLIDIAGTAVGTEYDRLDVSGDVELGGELRVFLRAGVQDRLLSTDTVTILTSGPSTLSGSFANAASGARFMTADGLGSFTISYGSGSPFDPNHVVLTGFVKEDLLSVDRDGDGVLDALDNCPDVPNGPDEDDQADSDNDGIGDACECGDFNGDGFVNTTDARLIQRCAVNQIPCQGLCDVTGDFVCNTSDARIIQRLVVGQLTKQDLRCSERP